MNPRKPTKPFPCTRCGVCCLAAKDMGLPVDDDGICLNLSHDNLCKIYDKRPEICRIKGRYIEAAARCNQLQDLVGTDPTYRVRFTVNL